MPLRVQEGQTAASLVQAFNLKGPFPASVDEVIVPVVIVRDFTTAEGEGAPGQPVRFAASVQIPASAVGAGNFAAVSMINPALSGVNVHLRKVEAGTLGTNNLVLQANADFGQLDLNNTGFEVRRVTPIGPVAAGHQLSINGGFNTPAPVPPPIWRMTAIQPASDQETTHHREFEWVIAPGHDVAFTQLITNTALVFSVEWLEVPVVP